MADCLISNQYSSSSSNRFGNQNNNNNALSSSDDNKKLFLGGLSWETEEKDLFDYFNQFGQVDKVTIKYNSNTGRSRGFGFVTFINDETVDQVLKTGPHVIKNRQVDPKRPKGKNGMKKIFVGGIDGDMTNDEIRTYFEQFGPIENIERPFDRQRNRSKEFCFVIFENGEAAESAISLPKQMIGGKECDIKVAHQNNRNTMMNQSMNSLQNNNNSMFGGSMMNRRNNMGGNNGNFMGNVNGNNANNGMGGGGGGQFNKMNRNNLNSNWRNSSDYHHNGSNNINSNNYRNHKYSDTQFLTNIDTMPSHNNNNYKPYNNSNFYPYWH